MMRNTTWKTTVLTAVMLAALAAKAIAQSQGATGDLTGQVKDETGGVLPGAYVTASAPGGRGYEATVTDQEGRFTFNGIAAGAYTVRAAMPGFVTAEQTGVKVAAGVPARIVVTLTLATRSEAVVVTGSRKEELVRHAPAAVAVIDSDDLAKSPATNYADLARQMPGVNAIQLGARDVALTPRTAAGVTARSTLALVDGRPVTQAYFGAVFWDLLSIDRDEIDRIEIARGPGSAMWGANALTGVVNIISKTPQELAGTSVRAQFGELNTADVGVIHAGGDGRLGYKISGSVFKQDPWERPTTLPDGTALPTYTNLGTTQYKTDLRVDFRPDADRLWRFDAGFAKSDGVLLTGLGPFDARTLHQGYAGARYQRGGFRFSAGFDAHRAEYVGFLTPDTVDVSAQTFRAEAQQQVVIDTRHVLNFGGAVSLDHFDFNLTPGKTSRQEAGVFVEDEIFLTQRVRARVGGRLDWFSTLGAAFSPRVALIVEPVNRHTFRAGYSRAYIAPSLLESFLYFPTGTTIGLPTGPFSLPFLTLGNESLDAETIDAFEVGYTGDIGSRVTLTASAYHQTTKGLIELLPSALYSPASPPPGWPLPAAALAAIPLPAELTYINSGSVRDRGLEVGLTGAIRRGLSAYVNYSLQDEPKVEADIPLVVNKPSRHRVNLGATVQQGRLIADVSASIVGESFWVDVQPFAGTTEGYGLLNAAVGLRFPKQGARLMIKGINLTDKPIQQHIFGDILRRRIAAELQVHF
jgi:outer membrane receptor protein involved in Fe transport